MIDDVSLKEIGFAWVINNNGQLIAHPDQSIKVFEEVTSFTSLEDTTLLKNDAIYLTTRIKPIPRCWVFMQPSLTQTIGSLY